MVMTSEGKSEAKANIVKQPVKRTLKMDYVITDHPTKIRELCQNANESGKLWPIVSRDQS